MALTIVQSRSDTRMKRCGLDSTLAAIFGCFEACWAAVAATIPLLSLVERCRCPLNAGAAQVEMEVGNKEWFVIERAGWGHLFTRRMSIWLQCALGS